jgi:uncharacterized iron-regulated membrane protein
MRTSTIEPEPIQPQLIQPRPRRFPVPSTTLSPAPARRPHERVREALAVPLLVLGSLLGAAGVSALIFAVDQLLPATLLP